MVVLVHCCEGLGALVIYNEHAITWSKSSQPSCLQLESIVAILYRRPGCTEKRHASVQSYYAHTLPHHRKKCCGTGKAKLDALLWCRPKSQASGIRNEQDVGLIPFPSLSLETFSRTPNYPKCEMLVHIPEIQKKEFISDS